MNKDATLLFFALIRSAIDDNSLCSQEKSLFTENLLPHLYKLSKKHDLAHIIGEALHKNGLLKDDEYSKKFQNEQFNAIFRCEQVNYLLNKVCNALEEIKVPYILLKGAVLRNYYPKLWMRTSGDVDILIEKENLSKSVKHLTENEGFVKKAQSNHDVTLAGKNTLELELHFDLIEDGRALDCRKVLSRFFESSNASTDFKLRRESTDEMFYFYHIAHMAKHFEVGGCGIRPFIDLWILNHKISYNKEKRDALLKEGRLYGFAKCCEALSEVWFSEKEHTEMTKKTENFILSGGVYGSTENSVLVRHAKTGGKIRFLISRIIPSFKALKKIYPELEKRPLLTPFYHIKRWIRICIEGSGKKAVREFKINNEISSDLKEEMQKFMDEIGLS